jgi:hypothetical protein
MHPVKIALTANQPSLTAGLTASSSYMEQLDNGGENGDDDDSEDDGSR